MPKKASKTPAAKAAGAALPDSSQGPLNPTTDPKVREDAQALIRKSKQDKEKRLEKAAASITGMAKAYEDKLGGLIVPFKDGAGREWPAVVVGLEEKRKPQLGPGRTAIVARVLVLSGASLQPYLADMDVTE